ncbi:MAG: lipopolysaccharide biosynthesis protein [Alphaproteobacteria bacterium]|nr:lipopolysaccharide biosynthesis protein [Alphaproteobacteria bacterium]
MGTARTVTDAPVIIAVHAATETSLGRKIARSAVFMVALRGVFRLIGLVSSLILLRLLAPSDFGVVGLVTAALAILEILGELSFEAGLVRMAAPQRIHYDTAWTLGLMRNAVMALGIAISGPLLAGFVADPRVVPLAYALAAVTLLQGLENVGVVDFQRCLEFDRFFRFQIFGKLAGVCVALPLAFALRNYWALMAGIAATRLAMTALSYAMSSYRPRLSLAGWRDLFDFSKWLLVANLEWVIDSYAMTFLTGRVAGPAAIGLYQVANRVASLPASEVAAPIRGPMYAGMSRTVHDMPRLRRQTLDGLFLSVAIVAPMAIGIALLAQPIVDLFFGWKWVAAIPLVRLCALAALFDAIGHYTHNLYLVMHRQRRFVGVFAVALAVRIPAIILGAWLDGINGAVFAMMATAVFNMVLWSANIFPLAGIPFGAALSGVWRTAFAALVMTAIVLWLGELWPEPREFAAGLARFAVLCLAGGLTHIATQFTAWRLSGEPAGAERHLIKTAAEAGARFLPLGWLHARS